MNDDFVPAAGRAWLTGAYDAIIALVAREKLLRGGVLAAVGEATADLPATRILELGCGTGSLSTAIARALPSAEVTGIDIDPRALTIAKNKPGAERVEWLRANVLDQPPEPGTWDCVVISLVLHHLMPADQPAALQAARSALRPGGTLHVIDFGRPDAPLTKLGWRVLQAIDGVPNTTPLGRGELPGMIDAAGFTGRQRRQRFSTMFGVTEQYSAVT